MIVLQGAYLLAWGIGLGIAAAVFSTRAMASLLYGVPALDPITFAGVSLVMFSVGLLASYLPARRASSVNPIESLRNS